MKLLEDSITKTLLQLGHEMSTNNTNSDTSTPTELYKEDITNCLEIQITEGTHPLQVLQDGSTSLQYQQTAAATNHGPKQNTPRILINSET